MLNYLIQVCVALPGIAVVGGLFAWVVKSVIRKELGDYRCVSDCSSLMNKVDERMNRMEEKFDRIIAIVGYLEGTVKGRMSEGD